MLVIHISLSDVRAQTALRSHTCCYCSVASFLMRRCRAGWLVASLTSQHQASVSHGRICSCTCCHTEIEVADQTFCLTQSQCTDSGPTGASADLMTPGVWQGNHWSTKFEVTGMTRPGKRSTAKAESNPGPGIMEADDRQVTTVFTVQPSFHHRHSTNRVA